MKKFVNNRKFGVFFELLRKQVNYHPDYQHELRANTIREYSGGKTSSLSVMYDDYPVLYFNMIESLKHRSGVTPQAKRWHDPDGDMWRKRVIKAIGMHIDRLGCIEQDKKIYYIKAVACRQAPCKNFNQISVSRLSEIYNYWLKRNEVNSNSVAAEAAILELEAEQFLQDIKDKHFNTK